MTDNKIPATLPELKTYLENQNFEVLLQPITEINLQEQLILSLGKDPKENDLLLRIFWSQEPETPEEPRFLQFFVLFPFLFDPEALNDIRSFIFNLNANFDMASFGLYETQHLIYYRYVHIHSNQKLEAETVLAIIASIQFLLEMLILAFIDLASRKKSLVQLQQEIKASLADQELPDLS